MAIDATGEARATQKAVDPFALYGDGLAFDVYRDGALIGEHRIRFEGTVDDLRVAAEFGIEIKVLFLTVYAMTYRSEARWRRGALRDLAVEVNDDGERFRLRARNEGAAMIINSHGGQWRDRAPLFPTDHWHAGVLGQKRVLNTLTGRVNKVEILPVAEETVPTERGAWPSVRYAYRGDLQTEVWYDRAMRWVKMRFQGRDGSTIDYICRRCLGPDPTLVSP